MAAILTSAAPARAADTVIEVMVANHLFEPAHVIVEPGTTVRWVNREKRSSHSVYFTGEAAFESPRFFPGESWSHRFEQAGSHEYQCGPHPEMRGRVVVAQ